MLGDVPLIFFDFIGSEVSFCVSRCGKYKMEINSKIHLQVTFKYLPGRIAV